MKTEADNKYNNNKKQKNCYGTQVFITGASSGIGKACAIYFAKKGCQVTGVSRHCTEGVKSYPGGGSLRMRQMDVTDDRSVEQVMNEIPRIDIAILAAGMGVAGSAECLPMEAAYEQMEVNYFGTLRVGSKVLGKMREQGKGLFLVIGSVAGRISIPMQSHYSASKYALEAYVDAVRLEMKQYGVRASILEPGDTKTGFTKHRKHYEPEDSPYIEMERASVAIMEHDEQTGSSPYTVARAAYKLAGKEHPPARVPIRLSYKIIVWLTKVLPDYIIEQLVEKIYLKK